jgi:hypothetical protein
MKTSHLLCYEVGTDKATFLHDYGKVPLEMRSSLLFSAS